MNCDLHDRGQIYNACQSPKRRRGVKTSAVCAAGSSHGCRFVRTNINDRSIGVLMVAAGLVYAWIVQPCYSVQEHRKAIDVGCRKQLFVDHAFVESSRGVQLTMNPPAQINEPVLANYQPWDGLPGAEIGYYPCIVKDGARFRIWGAGAALLPVRMKPDGPVVNLFSYAESDDGIHFTKPQPSLYEFGGAGSKEIGKHGRIGGPSVWIDPKAPPAQRYKTQAKFYPPDQPSEFHIYASRDGYRWTLMAKPVIGDKDTQSIIFWDDPVQRYLMYTRLWRRFGPRGETPEDRAQDAARSYRMIRRLESSDLVHWTNPHIVMEIDDLDMATYQTPTAQLPVDYYGGAVFRYPDENGVYILLAQAFWHWKKRPADQVWRPLSQPRQQARYLAPALVDVRLAVSRDGVHFKRVGGRKPFIRLGRAGTFSSQRVWAMPQPVRVGDNLWIYYAGKNRNKDNFLDPAASEYLTGIDRAIMRLDGFVSADADYTGGEMVTPLIKFEGKSLELNLDTSGGGSVFVELLDESNQPIRGYTQAEATPLCGNSVRMPVSWGETRSVSQLAGQPIKIRFVMRDCKLYAFQFSK